MTEQERIEQMLSAWQSSELTPVTNAELAPQLTGPQNAARKSIQKETPEAIVSISGQSMIVTLPCGATSWYGPNGRKESQ